ncbi:MAG: hypothetical protein ACR2GX_06015 [Candidatus Dormibacteria bacterium]
MSSRYGKPIELPWWTVPLALPPAVMIVLGAVVPQMWPARPLAILPAALLIVAIVRVARRTNSPSMQSVWISAAYGFWVLFPVAWVALLLAPHR